MDIAIAAKEMDLADFGSDRREQPHPKATFGQKRADSDTLSAQVTRRRRNHSKAQTPERLGRGGALRVSCRGQRGSAEQRG
jgi:hypothetical protein